MIGPECKLEKTPGKGRMGKKHWYKLIARPGFANIVAGRLRELDLEVFVPEQNFVGPQQPHTRQRQSALDVYCRFLLDERRLPVMSIPGVLDIAGIPEPTSFDEKFSVLQTKVRLGR